MITFISKYFLNSLDRQGRKRIVLDRQSQNPYLERYYIFLKDRTNFPFNIFLHKFLKSDPDDVHDHPWPYTTLILKGGYYEWLPEFNEYGEQVGEKRFWRGPGHFRCSAAYNFHRIELKQGVECWTLFMPGPQRREWGFLVNNNWIHHSQYLEEKRMPHKKKEIVEAYEQDDGPLTDEQLAQLPVQPTQQIIIDWDKIAENVSKTLLMTDSNTGNKRK